MELVINTFGTSLGRDNEGFVITHKDGRQRIPAGNVHSILLSKGAVVSSDAVMLAVEKEIDMFFIDKGGNPIARIWSPKYGSVSTIRKGQLAFTYSTDALSWIKGIISEKIDNQQAVLLMFDDRTDMSVTSAVDKAVVRLEAYRKKVCSLEAACVSDVAPTLRGWEGVASKIYFDCLNLFLPERLRFSQRTQHPAMDIANAMFNYGYGIMYGKIESMLIRTGIDPYVGVLHRDEYNRPVLVYDVIEKYRVWVDYIVLSLLRQNIVNDDYYSVREDGSVWLETLGRRVLIQAFNDYLEEVTDVEDMSRSRSVQIRLYCQKLAQNFKKYC